MAQSGARALRSGALEICISPANGWPSSRTKYIAPAADNAKATSKPATVRLGWANRPKLANIMLSQKISTTKNGMGSELSVSANISNRVCAMSVLTCIARALQGTLGIVLGRKLLKLAEECFACGTRLERSCRGSIGSVLTPHSIGHGDDATPHQLANVARLRTILRQEIVEQNDIGGHLLDLSALRVVRALRRGDQQAEDKCGDRPDQTGAEPDNIFCVSAQVVPWKEQRE
jgi:hypothetical protein